jgi:hypothetical protein
MLGKNVVYWATSFSKFFLYLSTYLFSFIVLKKATPKKIIAITNSPPHPLEERI